jgi:hypothetical protein
MKGFLADSGVIVVGETNGVDKLPRRMSGLLP